MEEIKSYTPYELEVAFVAGTTCVLRLRKKAGSDDYHTGLELLARAAKHGYPDAVEVLAIARRMGPSRLLKADIDAFLATVDEAPELLVVFLRGLLITDKDEKEAWMRRGAERGSARCQAMTGKLLSRRNGGEEEALVWFRRAAEQGLIYAQYRLGRILYGRQQLEESLKWLEAAAEAGMSKAMHAAAFCLVEQCMDYGRAIRLYEKAVAQEYAPSMFALGNMLGQGRVVEQDLERSLALLQRAAELGYHKAQNNLANMYARGQAGEDKAGLALRHYQAAADMGDAVAAYNLGKCHLRGRGCEKDAAKAMHYFEVGAEGGHVKSMHALAGLLMRGSEVPPDEVTGFVWLEKAAQQGMAKAMYSVGKSYMDGRGVEVDIELALYWFLQAGRQGDVSALHASGIFLAQGRGVTRDLTAAYDCFEQAALLGHGKSAVNCGKMWMSGTGVPKVDPVRARFFYERAAAAGRPTAMYALSIMYARGTGAEMDLLQSVRWMARGAARGNVRCQKAGRTLLSAAQKNLRSENCLTACYIMGREMASEPDLFDPDKKEVFGRLVTDEQFATAQFAYDAFCSMDAKMRAAARCLMCVLRFHVRFPRELVAMVGRHVYSTGEDSAWYVFSAEELAAPVAEVGLPQIWAK